MTSFTTEYSFLGSPVVSDGVVYPNTFGYNTFAFGLNGGVDQVAAGIARRPALSSLHPDLDLRVTP